MQTWRRFRALSAGDRRLIVEAVALLAFVRLALAILSFSTVRRVLLSFSASVLRTKEEGSTFRLLPGIAWAVNAVAGRLPFQTSCLVQSLAGEAMLRRRGIACELRFGVQPPARQGTLSAHSWIEHGGAVVLGAVDNLHDYRALSNQSTQNRS